MEKKYIFQIVFVLLLAAIFVSGIYFQTVVSAEKMTERENSLKENCLAMTAENITEFIFVPETLECYAIKNDTAIQLKLIKDEYYFDGGKING